MLLNILQISWVSLISKQSHCPKLNATLVQLAASSDEIPLPNSFGVWMVLLVSAKPELLGAPTARRVCAAAAAAPTVCCIIACVSAIVVVKHQQKFHVTLQGIPSCHHKKNANNDEGCKSENHPFKDCKLQTTEQTLSSKSPIQPDVTVALDQMLKSGGAAMAVSAQAQATSYGCSKCAPNALAPWGQNSALW